MRVTRRAAGTRSTWAFGTGEQIVLLPYTRDVFAATQPWTEAHHLFSDRPGPCAATTRPPGVIEGVAYQS
jgi:hypothetical protein